MNPRSGAGNPQASRKTSSLRALSERFERKREEERTQIARELHDELGQLLTGVKLDFSSTLRRLRELKVPGDVVDKVQSAVGQIDVGIAMVRRIASDLRPAPLDHHDLGGAIEFEGRRRTAQSGIPITVSHQVTASVSPELASATFRICQEALTNAIRHANATAIAIQVETSGRTLRLRISDNGVGIPAKGAHEGLGLVGMRERALAFGGTLDISSTEGRGTEIVVTLPL